MMMVHAVQVDGHGCVSDFGFKNLYPPNIETIEKIEICPFRPRLIFEYVVPLSGPSALSVASYSKPVSNVLALQVSPYVLFLRLGDWLSAFELEFATGQWEMVRQRCYPALTKAGPSK